MKKQATDPSQGRASPSDCSSVHYIINHVAQLIQVCCYLSYLNFSSSLYVCSLSDTSSSVVQSLTLLLLVMVGSKLFLSMFLHE
jgi:hypothetical protein